MGRVQQKPTPETSGRRAFLQKGAIGGVLLVLAGAGLAVFPGRRVAEPTAELLALDDRAFQVLVAIARRVVTAPATDHVALAHAIDRSLSYLATETQGDLRNLLHLVDNALASTLFDRRLVPFTQLSGADQDAALLEWRESSIAVRRTGYHALRKLCLVTRWAEETSFGDAGYSPPAPGSFRESAYRDSKWGDST